MKKKAFTKLLAAGSLAAVAVVPATVSAADSVTLTIADAIEVDATKLNDYADGVPAVVDFTSAPDFVSLFVDGDAGNVINIEESKATVKLPVLNDAQDAPLDGPQALTITLNKADGTTTAGIISYSVTTMAADVPPVVDPAPVEPATPAEIKVAFGEDVTVKVNGTSVANDAVVVNGDKVSITLKEVRGKTPKSISVNGTALTLAGNTAEYTVADTDTAIAITSEYNNLDSYTASFNEGVSLSVVTDDGNLVLNSGDTVYEGEKVKITVNVPEEKILKSFKLNGSVIENNSIVTVNGTNLNVTAEYEVLTQVTITIPEGVTVTKGTTVLSNGDKVTKGDSLIITAAKEGHSVKSITVNGTKIDNGSTYIVGEENITIVPEFVKDAVTVTFPVTLKAYDDEDSALKEVTILIKDSNRKTVATAETDKKGEIEINVAPGRYTYVVTSVPDGYICPSGSHTFTVSDDGKVKGTKSVTISMSEVTLKKVDSITKNGIAGVSLVIKNEDKETVGSGVTDSKGELTVTGLPAGDYTYSERYSASGYASDDGVYKFSIDEDGKVSGTTTTTSNPISIVFTVRDYASGKGLAGATLQIKNQLGRTIASVTTDSKGEASVPGLTAGRYTLSQSEAPKGYAKSTDEYTFDVLDSGLVSGTTSISNKELAPSQSGSNIANGDQNKPSNSQQPNTKPENSNGTSSAVTPNGNTNNSGSSITPNTTTSTGTNTTATTNTTSIPGGKTQGTVKTGVETEAPKSKAPIIAAVVGAVGAAGAAVSVVISRLRHKKNI